jgi:hypothetical protein
MEAAGFSEELCMYQTTRRHTSEDRSLQSVISVEFWLVPRMSRFRIFARTSASVANVPWFVVLS